MHSTEEQKHRRPGAWHGVKVAALACKVEQALAQVEVGVDVIVAQGTEAAGHTGEVASMVLWQMAAALALARRRLARVDLAHRRTSPGARRGRGGRADFGPVRMATRISGSVSIIRLASSMRPNISALNALRAWGGSSSA